MSVLSLLSLSLDVTVLTTSLKQQQHVFVYLQPWWK